MSSVLCSNTAVHYSQMEGFDVLDSIVNKFTRMEQQRTGYYFLRVVLVLMAIAIGEQLFSAYKTKNHLPELSISEFQQKPNRENPYDVEAINQRHLLGQFNRVVEAPKNFPTTNLKLTLRGAFTSSNPQNASAMIEGPDRKTLFYKVDGSVYGNTVLHSVFSNRVVLSRQGKLETLYFPAVGNRQAQLSRNPEVNSNQSKNRTENSSVMTQEQRQQLIKSRLQELRNRSRK
ncbi:MAG: general secretion pathway protein C [Oceanicoccus sp.]|jgi:general secretion pathway protein C